MAPEGRTKNPAAAEAVSGKPGLSDQAVPGFVVTGDGLELLIVVEGRASRGVGAVMECIARAEENAWHRDGRDT